MRDALTAPEQIEHDRRRPASPAPEPARDSLVAQAATSGNARFARSLQRPDKRFRSLAPPGVTSEPTLARKPKPKRKAAPEAPTYDGNPAEAVDYVNDYFERVGHLLMLKNLVEQQAIEDAKKFGELKEPPSIGAAVFAEIFSQVIGLIPGGKFVTMAVEGQLFASELGKLKKELDKPPERDSFDGTFVHDPAGDLEQAKAKGPSEATTKKAEKIVGGASTALGVGKAVLGAGQKAAEDGAAAAAAEAAAIEHAAMQSSRITDWSQAIQRADKQEEAIKRTLRAAAKRGVGHDLIKTAAVTLLGPYPSLEGMQEKLSRKYELMLYQKKLVLVTRLNRPIRAEKEDQGVKEVALEFIDGGKPSSGMVRRIADRMGVPGLAAFPATLAEMLKVPHEYRDVVHTASDYADAYDPTPR